MSPVSRKRQKKQQTSKASGSPRRALFDVPYGVLERGLRPTLREGDPSEAEMVVSDFLGSMRGSDHVQPGVPTGWLNDLIADLASRVNPEATAALVGFAHLAPAEASRDLARRGLVERSHPTPLPAWADGIGAWIPGRALVSADVLGDYAHVILEFSGPGASHGLGALVDFSLLGGSCAELYNVDDVDHLYADAVVAAAAKPGLATVAWLDPAAAGFLIARALGATDMTPEPDAGGTFDEMHALALARLRLVGARAGTHDAAVIGEALRAAGLHVPRDLDNPVIVTQAERDTLVARFLESAPATTLVGVAPESVEYLARLMVDFGCDDDDGRPLRVSPLKLGTFLEDWLPDRAVLDADDRVSVPAVIRAWVEFAVSLSGLPPAAATEVRAASQELITYFASEYDDPEDFGPGRALPDGIGDVSGEKEL